MKKFIILFLGLTLGTVAFADRGPVELRSEFSSEYSTNKANIATWYAGVTESEWRGYADWCISVLNTNKTIAGAYVYGPNLIHYMCETANADFVSEYDQKLASAGLGTGFPFVYHKLPKMCECWISNPSNATKVAKLGAVIANCRRNGEFRFWQPDVPVAERANIHSEMFRIYTKDINLYFDSVIRDVAKEIKRRMRNLGMKIVADGNTNPVQVEMDELTAALNAPRFAGLKEWFAKFYPEYRWIDSEWETDEEIEALKDAVYNGERDFGIHEKNILRVNLGMVKYNEFVETYNN